MFSYRKIRNFQQCRLMFGFAFNTKKKHCKKHKTLNYSFTKKTAQTSL